MSAAGEPVLVTGGAGFVGSHVVDALVDSGVRVRALVRPSTNRRFLDAQRVELRDGDITDGSDAGHERLVRALEGCSTLYHVAGVVTSARKENYQRVNVEGASRIARAAADAGVRRVILVSSQAAAGPSGSSAPRTERDAEEPMTAYGRSKLDGEHAVRAVANERGLQIVIVRPPAVYGPRDRAFVGLFKLIRLGIVPLHGAAHSQRISIVHAADLAHGIVLAATRAPSGATYFLTDGAQHTAIELAQAIARALGKKPAFLTIPLPVLSALAFAAEIGERVTGRAATVTRERLRQWTVPYWTISDARARAEIGYAPSRDLVAGMAETAAWYRSAGWL
ncbi:MAG: NAD-dependent epimerase/dehydratase family protein [bacterium]